MEKVTEKDELPHTMWPAGHILEPVDIDASHFGLIIGQEGRVLTNLKNQYGVDIYVPLKDEECKLINILGRSENIK